MKIKMAKEEELKKKMIINQTEISITYIEKHISNLLFICQQQHNSILKMLEKGKVAHGRVTLSQKET